MDDTLVEIIRQQNQIIREILKRERIRDECLTNAASFQEYKLTVANQLTQLKNERE